VRRRLTSVASRLVSTAALVSMTSTATGAPVRPDTAAMIVKLMLTTAINRRVINAATVRTASTVSPVAASRDSPVSVSCLSASVWFVVVVAASGVSAKLLYVEPG